MHTVSHVASHDISHVASHVASRTVSQAASQPERIVQIVEDVSKTVSCAGGGGAYATKSWKEAAIKVDVTGYVTNMELKNIELVSVTCCSIYSFSYKSRSLL